MEQPAPESSPPHVAPQFYPGHSIILRTMDNHEFAVDITDAQRMGAVCRALALDHQLSPPAIPGRITLADVSGTMLQTVVHWMVHHRGDWSDMTDSDGGQLSWPQRMQFVDHDPWEKRFFGDLSAGQLLELAKCTRYLSVEPMKQAVCRYIARTVRHRTPEEIGQFYGVAVKPVARLHSPSQ